MARPALAGQAFSSFRFTTGTASILRAVETEYWYPEPAPLALWIIRGNLFYFLGYWQHPCSAS